MSFAQSPLGFLAFHFNSFNFFNFQGSFPLYFDSLFILLGIFSNLGTCDVVGITRLLYISTREEKRRAAMLNGLMYIFNSFNFFNFQGSFPLYFDSLFILLGIFSCTKPRLLLRVIVQKPILDIGATPILDEFCTITLRSNLGLVQEKIPSKIPTTSHVPRLHNMLIPAVPAGGGFLAFHFNSFNFFNFQGSYTNIR
jgi:hypothetical protein